MRDRSLLHDAVVQAALQMSPGFHTGENGHLRCRWRFPDFTQSFAFATRIARLAEEKNHHPDITVGWGHLSLDLFTHDKGGITQRDLDLVAAIDALGEAAEPRPSPT